MEIIGCGIEDHASHWVDVTNNSGTRFEWEVWLDVAVITRSNARQPAYEK